MTRMKKIRKLHTRVDDDEWLECSAIWQGANTSKSHFFRWALAHARRDGADVAIALLKQYAPLGLRRNRPPK
jgi:hypothetical protein